MSGNTANTLPAMITGQGVERLSLTGSLEIATIKVYISLEVINKSGYIKSFQRAMNARVAQAARAGVTTGSTRFQKMRNSLLPSKRACSMISVGKLVMYWRM